VSVVAVNGAGRSAAGTATFTPATTPGAPLNVRARPGSIIVTWDPPTDTGGAVISSYDITVTDPDGNSSQYTYNGSSNPTGATACTTGRSCTITQIQDAEGTWIALPDDVEYTVEVRAVTSAGTGPPSDDSLVVSGQPDAPTNLVATSGLYSFELCWTPPTGSITSYKIDAVYSTTSPQKEVLVADVINTATCAAPKVGVVVEGWDDGSTMVAGGIYAVRVSATFSASDYIYGLASDSVNATPYGPPGAPAITGIDTTASTATITWSAAAPYGSAILAYLVQTSTGESCATAGALTCTISGLAGNATYSFTVTATNAAGDGPPSAAVSAVIDATAPTPSWSAPTIGPSRRATSTGTFDENVYYVLTFDEVVSGFTVADLSNAGTAGTCSYAISQVIPNRQYDVVATCSAVGTLISRVASASVTDSAGNAGPTLTVDAALVTLNDPSSTTTTSTTSTTIAQTTTTNTLGVSATTTLPGGSTTTTTLTGNPGDGSTSIAPISGTPTTRPNSGVTTTTIGSGSGLPPSVDKKLDDDDGLVDGDDKVDAGRPLRVVRCGFAVGEAVDVYVAGNKIKSLSADDKGCISTTVTTPDAPGKTVTIAVYAPGSKRGAKTTIAVSGQLTATGSNLDGPLALAFLLLVVGALIAALPRRRRA
jgi:YD repeat-containing protein